MPVEATPPPTLPTPTSTNPSQLLRSWREAPNISQLMSDQVEVWTGCRSSVPGCVLQVLEPQKLLSASASVAVAAVF